MSRTISFINDSDPVFGETDNSIEVELELTITAKMRVKVNVSDYKAYYDDEDDDGYSRREIDTSDCDFETAIEEQVTFPDYLDVTDIAYEVM